MDEVFFSKSGAKFGGNPKPPQLRTAMVSDALH
jgi:hypothetical protein